MRMRVTALIVCIVVLAAAAGARATALNETSSGAYASVRATSAQECARLCARDQICMAWNYDAQASSPTNACALKAAIPASSTQENVNSGLSSRARAYTSTAPQAAINHADHASQVATTADAVRWSAEAATQTPPFVPAPERIAIREIAAPTRAQQFAGADLQTANMNEASALGLLGGPENDPETGLRPRLGGNSVPTSSPEFATLR